MSSAITAGTHTARARAWSWDKTKDEAVCLAIMFELTEGDLAGLQIDGRLYFDTDRPDTKGRTAADRSIEALRGMGLKGGLDTIDENEGGLDSGLVSLVVEINAEGWPRVKFINPARGARELRTFAPPNASEKRAFFAQMNARLKGAEAGARASGARPASAPARSGPPRGFAQQQGDDDVPF